MKALTVCQPHASALMFGPKRYENRTWSTSYRGPVLIHAGKNRKWMTYNAREFYAERDFAYRETELPFGAMLGVMWLESCPTLERVPVSRRFPDCAEGPCCWHMVDPLPFPETIPAVGKQGLFEFDVPEHLAVWFEADDRLRNWLVTNGGSEAVRRFFR